MNRIPQILDSIHAHTGVHPNNFLTTNDEESVWLRYVTAWICTRVAKIKPMHVSSALGVTLSRSLLSYGCRKIDKAIIEQYPQTLDLIVNVCKDSNLIQTKTGGTSSPSDLYNTLYAYLPSGRASMLQTLGKISPTDTTASRQPSSVTSSHTKADNSTTPKADSHTSPTQRGTRSFYFTSDLNWANREALRYDFATPSEQRQIYSALLAASAWGRKCAYEHRIRMQQLKEIPNTVYSTIID